MRTQIATSSADFLGPGSDADFGAPQLFRHHRCLRLARQYAEAHLEGDLSLGTVARAVGLERKYFSSLFRSQAGVGFKEWTQGLRLARAIELFRTGDECVTSVALTVGFRDLRTFERAFRRLMNLSPREFRKACLQQARFAAQPPDKRDK